MGIQNRVDRRRPLPARLPERLPARPGSLETGFGDIKLGAKYKFLDDYSRRPGRAGPEGLGQAPDRGRGQGARHRQASFGARPHPLQEPQPQGRPPRLDRLRDQRRSGRCGHRQRLQVGHRPQRPGLQGVPVPGRGDGEELLAPRTSPQTNPVDLIMGPVFWFKPGVFIRPALLLEPQLRRPRPGLAASRASPAGRSPVGYHPGTPCCEVYVPPPPPPPPPRTGPRP